MQKKTIFFDIDGTLLDCWHNKPFTIPESNRQALQLLKQQGHQIIACTGRHEAFLKKYFPCIFESYITMNGSHIVYKGDIIYDRIFSLEEVSYLMKHFDDEKRGMHSLEKFVPGAEIWIRTPFVILTAYMEWMILQRQNGIPVK